MKTLSISITLLLTIALFTQCNKEDTTDAAKKEEKELTLKDFSLSQNELSLIRETEQRVAITSGNEQYKLEQSEESKNIAQVSLSDNKKEIVIKALTEGKITIKAIDIPTKKEILLNIFVSSKVTPEDYELSEDKKTLVRWKGENIKSLDMNIIEGLKEVTKIEKDAFRDHENLEHVILPKELTFIGDRVFYRCEKLIDAEIPDSVTSLGGASFSGCKNLEKVNLPKGITFIDAVTLYNCAKITEITIPEGVTEIDWSAFAGTGIKELVFPSSIQKLGDRVIQFCKQLEKIVFKSDTPPTIKYSSLRRAVEEPPLKIYVPKGKKQTYIDSSKYWKDFEGLIIEL